MLYEAHSSLSNIVYREPPSVNEDVFQEDSPKNLPHMPVELQSFAISGATVYEEIMWLLEQNSIPFTIISHPPEGNTVKASILRGHDLKQAAKSIVTLVETSKTDCRFVLAVVGGHQKIDMKSLACLFAAKKARFATTTDAARLTGCEMGAVPPISFNESLTTVFDTRLAKEPQIVFNAGRLDRSVVVNTERLLAASAPYVGAIGGEVLSS